MGVSYHGVSPRACPDYSSGAIKFLSFRAVSYFFPNYPFTQSLNHIFGLRFFIQIHAFRHFLPSPVFRLLSFFSAPTRTPALKGVPQHINDLTVTSVFSGIQAFLHSRNIQVFKHSRIHAFSSVSGLPTSVFLLTSS